MMRNSLIILAASLTLSACAHRRILQVGHGESFTQTIALQADLGRPTVADSAYPLTGFEGLELRQRVTDQSTDEESGNAEAVNTISVQ